MQDIHSLGGGTGGEATGGRFLGGGDRRLRQHNHQALKCPRCDSLNTKFCYYNNYNLSQPRHFCKSCRRYWTKGGVFRNVPVGGGCRKSKRAKPKSDTVGERKSNAQSSSSENSSLTASATQATANTTTNTPPSASTSAAPAAGAEESPAPSNTTSHSATVYNFSDPRYFTLNPPSLDQNHQMMMNHQSNNGQIFTSEMESFTSMMTSSAEMMGYDVPRSSYQGPGQENHGSGLVRTSGPMDEFKMMSNGGLTAALDWGSGGESGGGDQGLFDLTAATDPAYWSQTQWTDNDQSLNYLP